VAIKGSIIVQSRSSKRREEKKVMSSLIAAPGRIVTHLIPKVIFKAPGVYSAARKEPMGRLFLADLNVSK
jgi:hypothetical protein